MAQAREQNAEVRQAAEGQAKAQADSRTEQALTRLRDLRKEIESLAMPEEKVASIRDRLAETVTQLNALRNADGSNTKAVDDALAAADELAKLRIDAIEKPAREAAEREASRTRDTIAELSRSVATFGDSRTQVARAALSALVESYGPRFALAGFQVAAAARILGSFESSQPTATLVSAGTGSGKTLAFYLPALSRIASHIQRDAAGDRWVKVLALYPRNELLKDQFAEVYGQARRLDGLLAARGRRKIVIGTFFGPTPRSAETAHKARSGWRQTSAGLVCEYLRCPVSDCDGAMPTVARDVSGWNALNVPAPLRVTRSSSPATGFKPSHLTSSSPPPRGSTSEWATTASGICSGSAIALSAQWS